MSATLSKRARQFQAFLDEHGSGLTVLELPDSTRTAADAADALGCSTAQIVKSLVFRDLVTDGPVVVLASGPNRVDEKVIATHLGHEVGKAGADYVKAVTGYSIGGVPPIGHRSAVAVFVDEDLLAFDEVWAAAGTPHAVFKISGKFTSILGEHTVISVK
jgi:prolyl-tRNA editing enzyme YbaK/EbsC (Cys-tRNA(Pro) deacylase)